MNPAGREPRSSHRHSKENSWVDVRNPSTTAIWGRRPYVGSPYSPRLHIGQGVCRPRVSIAFCPAPAVLRRA
jgi:hypothetical protein